MSVAISGIFTFFGDFLAGPIWDVIKGVFKRSSRYKGPLELDFLPYKTNFVSTKLELKEIYKIRNSIFGGAQISGYAYNHLQENCPYAMRFIRDHKNKIMGYYGICRIDEETLHAFQTGDLSHKEVIQRAIPIEANMEKCYLYLVGIVTKGGYKAFNSKRNEIAAFLICDMVKYISLFTKSNAFTDFKIIGYPSTPEGDNLLSSFDLAFNKTGQIVDKKSLQKVYLFNLNRLHFLQKLIKQFKTRDVYIRYRKEVISKGWDDLKPMLV